MIKEDFIREAVVTDIIDGDTIVVLIDLGFCVYHSIELRFLDVYAFETKGSEKLLGLADKESLSNLLPIGSRVIVQTFKTKSGKLKRSFTRYIAKVWTKNGVYINEVLKLKPQGGSGSVNINN